MSTPEQMAETVAKAMKLVPTTVRAYVLESDPSTVVVKMDPAGTFRLKVSGA